ncbi:MAG TPA: hypothetical protein VIH58_11085, partial [Chthoniobacterales bacterium]
GRWFISVGEKDVWRIRRRVMPGRAKISTSASNVENASLPPPFLLRHPELRRTGRDKEFYTI